MNEIFIKEMPRMTFNIKALNALNSIPEYLAVAKFYHPDMDIKTFPTRFIN